MNNANDRLFIAKPFSYFDLKGKCNLPSPDLIRANARQGIVTALVLDRMSHARWRRVKILWHRVVRHLAESPAS
ncbi:hypothetical protein [Burkholderia glumae]|uniref:hypothetical protein n=1 Tax=Burkholderia glumae TaxID=337 RepID=UPI0013204347|nr:hypothetical protein [Burkholderia glumae]QHE09456.1 hypothetical protein GQR88_02995 [Burkholderia glumae AU6208]